MATTNWSFKRGDTRKWVLTCTSKTGGPLNLTGATLRMYAKAKMTDLDAAAIIKKDSAGIGGIVVTDAPNGLATVTILPADTLSFVVDTTLAYDIQVTEADGTVTTLVD